MEGGGDWKHGIWTDSREERRIKLQFQGAGAHLWLLARRNGLARQIYNRLVEDDRFSSKQILSEVPWRPRTLIPAGGFSANQMAFGPNSADLFGWQDRDADFMLTQGAFV